MSISSEGNAYLQVTLERCCVAPENTIHYVLYCVHVTWLPSEIFCANKFTGSSILASLQGKQITLRSCHENCSWDCIPSGMFIGTFYPILHTRSK